MTKYIQTNEKGYVTGIVEEPILLGLFGGSSKKPPIELTDEKAREVEEALKIYHSRGEGLHIDEVVKNLNSRSEIKF